MDKKEVRTSGQNPVEHCAYLHESAFLLWPPRLGLIARAQSSFPYSIRALYLYIEQFMPVLRLQRIELMVPGAHIDMSWILGEWTRAPVHFPPEPAAQ